MEIDRRLHEAGQSWRESQGPPFLPPGLGPSQAGAPRGQWRKGLAPVAAAAAVAGIALGVVNLQGGPAGHKDQFAGTVATPSAPVSASSTATSAQPSSTGTATSAGAVTCLASQIRPSLGDAGPAAGSGHVQILLKNVGGRPCQLGGVFPLQGVTASGTATRLAFPGDSATASCLELSHQVALGPSGLRLS
jgi:hypothetical protein